MFYLFANAAPVSTLFYRFRGFYKKLLAGCMIGCSFARRSAEAREDRKLMAPTKDDDPELSKLIGEIHQQDQVDWAAY